VIVPTVDRVPVGGLLIDGYCGAQSLNEVNVGPVNLTEKLPRVGRERLDIPPLPLGKDCVKGK